MKLLNGSEVAGYMKENQAHTARSLLGRGIKPKLVIIRDNDNPVIMKYVRLKQAYGEDIRVEVEDWLCQDIEEGILRANVDDNVHGIIVQLPLCDESKLVAVGLISRDKDVDGLRGIVDNQQNGAKFESATATAINWLLASYDIDLKNQKIALVGKGKLVGAPLERMWGASGYDITVFRSHSDLSELKNFDVIVSATGVPNLITSEMVKAGAVVVDAGTASEDGVLVGDVSSEVRKRADLKAITPRFGGVGPLTVTTLFEHVLIAAADC